MTDITDKHVIAFYDLLVGYSNDVQLMIDRKIDYKTIRDAVSVSIEMAVRDKRITEPQGALLSACLYGVYAVLTEFGKPRSSAKDTSINEV